MRNFINGCISTYTDLHTMFIRLWRSAISYEKKKSIIWKNHICSSAIMDPFQTPGAKNNTARWKIWYFRTFLCICFFLYDILFKLWHDLEYTPKNGIPFLIFSIIMNLWIHKKIRKLMDLQKKSDLFFFVHYLTNHSKLA